MFKREHLRGVSVFFGIGEERAFYVERTPSLLAERLRHNVAFFYLNYMLLTAVLFCLTLMTSPFAIFGMALLGLAWMWVIRASQSGALVVGSTWSSRWTRLGWTVPKAAGVQRSPTLSLPCSQLLTHFYCIRLSFFSSSAFSIPQKTATIGMAVISFFVLMYLLTNIFWWTLFSTGLLVAIHAFLRDASMHKDMDDVVTMQGDLNLGEDASFLNGSNAV